MWKWQIYAACWCFVTLAVSMMAMALAQIWGHDFGFRLGETGAVLSGATMLLLFVWAFMDLEQ